MSEKNIRTLRAESVLGELVSEAVGTLGNDELNGLTVVKVECSRGLSDATVYIVDDGFSESQKQRILSGLKKSSSYIARYCTSSDAMAKMPKLTYKFDDSLEREERLEKILGGIKKDG
jgi:ribosome-binding factor A